MAQTQPRPKKPNAKKKGAWFHKFCEEVFLWLLGIIVSGVPIFLKHLDIYLRDKSISNYNFLKATLSDFDFSFISVSVLFTLWLEELLLKDKVPEWHRAFRVCTGICLVVTCSIYCVAFFVRGQLPHKLPITQFEYNMFTLCLTIIFGVVCHISISLREGGSTC